MTSPEPKQEKPTGSIYIRNIQHFLNSRGYQEARKGNFKPLVIDGFSGPLSKNAVIRIAQYFGKTTVDGLVGPKTWEQLFNELSNEARNSPQYINYITLV